MCALRSSDQTNAHTPDVLRVIQDKQQQSMAVSDPGRGAFLFCSVEESIHSRLRRNDDQFTDLQLWLNSASCVGALTEALEENTSIQDVCLLIHESFGGGQGQGQAVSSTSSVAQQQHDVLDLFAALGRLPHLTKLFFNTYRFPFVATLPVQAFANVFQGAHVLQEFKLWRTDLYGCCQDDIDGWGRALAHNCHNLQEFRLIKCRLTEENEEEAIRDDAGTFGTLDPILQALAKLPRLKEVELSATKLSALGTLSPPCLRELLRSPSLESFSLLHFDLSENAVLAIAGSLLQQHGTPATTRSSLGSPTTTTQQSSSIKTIHGSTSIAPNQFSKSNMKHVKLSGVGSTASMFRKPVRDAFRTVLQCNYVLETLFLFDARNLQEEIRFYLKLNRLGRNRLLHDPQRYKESRSQEWIEILVQVRHDLDCLFYFLHECPLLLSTG